MDRVLYQHEHFWRDLLPVDRNTPILDIGCGDGNFLLYLKKAGYTSLHGVDVSPDQVEVAHSLGLAQVERGGALEYLARHEGYFGVISAQNILEHVTLEELFTLLDAANRALRKGGLLWIVVPNGLSHFGVGVRYSDLTHETCYTPTSMVQALRVCGFEPVEFREFSVPIVHGVKSFVRFLIWKTLRTVMHLWRLAEFGEVGPAAVYSHDMQVIARKK
jgi:2-polyprenyl-3-methyl-5-hydroxy-6-metoxy-1,4-benzoquinol methylase